MHACPCWGVYTCVQVSVEARQKHQFPWSWSYKGCGLKEPTVGALLELLTSELSLLLLWEPFVYCFLFLLIFSCAKVDSGPRLCLTHASSVFTAAPAAVETRRGSPTCLGSLSSLVWFSSQAVLCCRSVQVKKADRLPRSVPLPVSASFPADTVSTDTVLSASHSY